MRRCSGLVLTLSGSAVLLVSPPAVAEGEALPTLLPSASVISRYESRDGYDRLGVSRGRWLEGDRIFYRTRLGLRTTPVQVGEGLRVEFAFVPQATGTWGGQGSTVSDPALGLHEGYLVLSSPDLAVDVGRFELNYGDALVIGNLDWHQTARAFEGIRARVPLGATGTRLDLFATQQAEGVASPAVIENVGAGDDLFFGVYASLGPALVDGLSLDVYSLAQLWPHSTNVPIDPAAPEQGVTERAQAAQLTQGLRVKQRAGLVDYRLEAGGQVGHRPRPGRALAARAWQVDAELGVSLLADRLRVALEGLYASGDDPTTPDVAEGWDDLYPTGHKWLGLSDIMGRRQNVYGPVGHLSLRVLDDLTVRWQGHTFFRPERAEGVRAYAGSEVDTAIDVALGRGLKLSGLWAHFLADREHYPLGGTADYLELELRYAFAP